MHAKKAFCICLFVDLADVAVLFLVSACRMAINLILYRGVSELRIQIRMNIDIRIPIHNISYGCHADIANNKKIIF